MDADPHTKALAAYAILKQHMRETYPPDQYVALKWGRVVADAVSYEHLEVKLASISLKACDVVIEQAGHEAEIVAEYPGWIMMEAIYGHWNECVTPPAGNEY